MWRIVLVLQPSPLSGIFESQKFRSGVVRLLCILLRTIHSCHSHCCIPLSVCHLPSFSKILFPQQPMLLLWNHPILLLHPLRFLPQQQPAARHILLPRHQEVMMTSDCQTLMILSPILQQSHSESETAVVQQAVQALCRLLLLLEQAPAVALAADWMTLLSATRLERKNLLPMAC